MLHWLQRLFRPARVERPRRVQVVAWSRPAPGADWSKEVWSGAPPARTPYGALGWQAADTDYV